MNRFGKQTTGLCLIAITAMITAAAVPMSAQAEVQGEQLVTIAGVPGNGYRDDTCESARFASPLGLDVKDGGVLIADTDNNLIRGCHRNRVTTVAGNIAERDAYGNAAGGFYDTSVDMALFSKPADCLRLSDGRIAVADRDNHAVRVIGSSWVYTLNGTSEEGYAEGKPGQAKFSSPSGLAEGPDGSIYVADTGNHCIRKMDKNGNTSLIAGIPGQSGLMDGAAEEALFMEPSSVAVGSDGSIYVADSGNQRIRKIAGGQVTTLAGGGSGAYLDTEYRTPGSADGRGGEARFWFPGGICMADQVVIVADTGNHVIRAISPSGQVRVIAGSGEAGYQDGDALEAELNRPGDVAWERNTLYILDSGNSSLRFMRFSPEKWLESIGEGVGGND